MSSFSSVPPHRWRLRHFRLGKEKSGEVVGKWQGGGLAMNSLGTSKEGASVPPENGVSFCRRADPYPRASGQVLSDSLISIGLNCWSMSMLSTYNLFDTVFNCETCRSSGVGTANRVFAHPYLKNWSCANTETIFFLLVTLLICSWEYYMLQSLSPPKKCHKKQTFNKIRSTSSEVLCIGTTNFPSAARYVR